MADYGTDLAGVEDLDPFMREVSGDRCLAEALARRLITPIGGLFYDREYGHDVRQYLNAAVQNPKQVATRVETELLKDERVDSVDVAVTFASESLRVVVRGVGGAGPFDFVLDVSAAAVELLLNPTG